MCVSLPQPLPTLFQLQAFSVFRISQIRPKRVFQRFLLRLLHWRWPGGLLHLWSGTNRGLWSVRSLSLCYAGNQNQQYRQSLQNCHSLVPLGHDVPAAAWTADSGPRPDRLEHWTDILPAERLSAMLYSTSRRVKVSSSLWKQILLLASGRVDCRFLFQRLPDRPWQCGIPKYSISEIR